MVFLALVLISISSSASAWSGDTHRLLAKESLKDVAEPWGLNQPVERTSFDRFLKKFSQRHPAIQTREEFCGWLQINPDSPFDRPSPAEQDRQTLTPLEILTLYSARADDGRDMHLPYDQGEQFWFGSGTKSGSQAFRHMEKPPFNPLHPLNTLGFPLGRIGQASRRAQIYFDLALAAYQLGEPYWAWNFLGAGLHYIQDLGQPYHTAQLLAPLAIKGVQAYFQWGRKENVGWIQTVTRVVSNTHHYFEGYTDYLLWQENSSGRQWEKALSGRETFGDFGAMEDLAKQVRGHANQSALATVQATFQITGKNLLTAKIYDAGEVEGRPDDPLPYLTADQAQRMRGAGQISRIVVGVFAHVGKAQRTYVARFLKEKTEEP
ncbi:MAG: hypothetical protein HY466_00100 [Deltaproteobacteria bacterium]|nr:hypothetical protein [Deltaproteobacteria bacterium]